MAKPSTSATPSGSLATGLTHSWLLNEGTGAPKDYVTSVSAGTPQNGMAWVTVAGDPALQATASNQYCVLMADEDMPTQTFSMVVGYQKTDATLRNNGSVGIISGTQAERCAIALPYGDGVFSFDFGGFTDGSTRVSVSGLTKGNDIWIATTGARGMELWQNGTKVVSNAANPTRTATTGGFMLGNANGSASDLANWIFVHTYNVQLSTTDIATLTANPYAMYGAAATPITVTPPADSLAGGELA